MKVYPDTFQRGFRRLTQNQDTQFACRSVSPSEAAPNVFATQIVQSFVYLDTIMPGKCVSLNSP